MLISYKTLIFRGIHAQTIREDPSYVVMYVSMYRTPYPLLTVEPWILTQHTP